MVLKLPKGGGEDMSRMSSLGHPWKSDPFGLEGQRLQHHSPHEEPQESQRQRGSQGVGVQTLTPSPAPHRMRFGGPESPRIILTSHRALGPEYAWRGAQWALEGDGVPGSPGKFSSGC